MYTVSIASFPGLARFYLPFAFRRSSDSVYYCERKQEIKTGEAWHRGYELTTTGIHCTQLHA